GLKDPITHHCYTLHKDPLPWGGARDRCVGLGEYLVTITSADEMALLVAHLGTGERWTGGQVVSVGNFAWSDGEIWDFGVWEHYPPPDATKPCIKLKDGFFATDDCQKGLPHVCERSPAGTD